MSAKNVFFLTTKDCEKQVESEADLQTLLEAPAGSLAIRDVSKKSLVERILFPLLGLKIADEVCCFSFYKNTQRKVAFISFESEDSEWLLRPNGTADEIIEFSTQKGERFTESVHICVPESCLEEAFLEFYRTRKRPRSFRWVRTKE